MKIPSEIRFRSRDETLPLDDSENLFPVRNGTSYSYSNGDAMVYHETLDIHCVGIELLKWTYQLCETLIGADHHDRDQLLRVAQSVFLSLAEGAKQPLGEQKKSFPVVLGLTLECAATLDVLVLRGAIDEEAARTGYDLLFQIICMLTKMAS